LNAVSFDNHVIDQQPRVGLAQSRVARPKTISQQLTESTEHVGRNAPLAEGELSLQRGDVGGQSRNPVAVMGQALGKIPVAR
jgi:hypothetical protein